MFRFFLQHNQWNSTYPLPMLNFPLTGGKLSEETTFYLESHIFKAAYFRFKVMFPKDATHVQCAVYKVGPITAMC